MNFTSVSPACLCLANAGVCTQASLSEQPLVQMHDDAVQPQGKRVFISSDWTVVLFSLYCAWRRADNLGFGPGTPLRLISLLMTARTADTAIAFSEQSLTLISVIRVV